MRTPVCRWTILLLLLTLNASCSPPTPSAAPAASAPPAPAAAANIPVSGKSAPPAPSANPINTAEAEALTVEIQKAVAAGDTAAFAAQIDFPALIASVVSVIEGNSVESRQFRAGFESQIGVIRSQLVEQIFQHVRGGGSYQYLRTVKRDEGPRPLFRMRTPEDGLNYHELVLARRPEGVRVVDLYVYVSGEKMSETMQRMLLTALPADKQSFLSTLSGSAKASIAKILPVKDMTDAYKAGDYPRARAIYDSLDPALRKEKGVQLTRIMAAQKEDQAIYIAAIDDYRAAFPNDACIDLMSLDSHVISNRFNDFHNAINRLDRQVGGDPYLQVMRANALIKEGKLQNAEQIAQQMLATEPRSLDAHWILVSRSLAEKDFDTTANLLTKIRDELGMTFSDLTQVPAYAEFVTSPAYKKWKKSE